MTFLERFKGRTGFVTKEGIDSLMSEGGLPVEKVHLKSQEDQPSTRKKSRTISHSITSRPTPPQQQENGKSQANNPLLTPMKSMTPKATLDRSPGGFHKMQAEQGLKVSTDRLFYQKDKQNVEFEPKKHFLTPQHKYIPLREPNSADTWSFSQRVNDLKNSSRLISPNMQIERNLSSTTPKRYENNGLIPIMRNMSNQSLHTPTNYSGYKFFGDYQQQEPQGQDLRQSHMDYFERQEQVINKYKHRVSIDNSRFMNQDRAAMLVLSPKHNVGK